MDQHQYSKPSPSFSQKTSATSINGTDALALAVILFTIIIRFLLKARVPLIEVLNAVLEGVVEGVKEEWSIPVPATVGEKIARDEGALHEDRKAAASKARLRRSKRINGL